MVLTIDIGNSNIVFAAYEQGAPRFISRLKTDVLKTEAEYAVLIRSVLHIKGFHTGSMEGAIISSVVPALSPILDAAVKELYNVRVLHVGPGIKTGLNIKIDSPGQTGADLVCTAVGTLKKYTTPAIIIDLGTVSKITVLDRDRSFIGGALAPGVRIGLDAMSSHSAQLPHISLDGEVPVIGANTVDCMRSGVILGAASMIDGMVRRYKQELGEDTTAVACGGLVGAIIPHCSEQITIDPTLLLDGLYELYLKNC